MWPWEHLAVAYVLYSLCTNLWLHRSPSTRETIAVAIGSQLPDLVDKPLAWTFGLTETGYSIGHSIFVAPLICLVAFAVVIRSDTVMPAVGFSLAYASHLVTDVLNPVRYGRPIEPRVVLWPLSSPPTGNHGGLVDHFVLYVLRDTTAIVESGLTFQLGIQLLLGLAVVGLWLSDGAPVLSDGWRVVQNTFR
ncbi:metal-dependent hydrolase [Halobacteria archaeon AArc-curdl1]|uniref:Metal-dependent hydrolase n=1 Tax=Natronosalvus hydrolyticus TaxID=2979988 RepID=A0AAP2Z956_9EURY|nr:metal-dependent hydrolase [Halobacteria archaeon AArc-curdl1]